MSQIEIKDFKIEQELAISQRPSERERSSVNDDYVTRLDLFPLLPSAHLHKSINAEARMSENFRSRQGSSLFNQAAMRTSTNLDSFDRGSLKNLKVQLQKIGESEIFECGYCHNCPEKCPFCEDSKILKGNSNIIKFFQFIIGFKIGVNSSYGQRKLGNSHQKQSVNNFCNEYYSSRASVASLSSQPDRSSLKSKRFIQSEVIKELHSMPVIHDNYCCDTCTVSPIVGVRYHCAECGDYDECEGCHGVSGHCHLMEKIQRCGRSKQIESIVHLLTQPQSKRSLRPPPSIKKSMDTASMTTRSALR